MRALVAQTIDFAAKIFNRLLMHLYITRFSEAGSNVIFHWSDFFSFRSIALGNNVFIAKGAHFSTSKGKIIIESGVMFGPGVKILGGNHRFDVAGQFMIDLQEKKDGTDGTILIEGDVWIGANAIILESVTIGFGSVIGAGSVVTESIPENSIAVGVPARVIRKRFDQEIFEEHKRRLCASD